MPKGKSGQKAPIEALKRAQTLRAEIEKHNKLYHQLDNPEISDAEYDNLVLELKQLETTYPDLRSSDSPTQKVGAKPRGDFAKVSHSVPMISLDNAFDDGDLSAFEERALRFLKIERAPWTYLCEYKMDGLAVEIVYEKGVLKIASTRGDGVVGEDITENVKRVKAIPNVLKDKVSVEVRGEIFMTLQDFKCLNNERAEAGENLFVNPRNAAAGSLRQLNPEITASRPLSFYAYSMGLSLDCKAKSQVDLLKTFEKWGLPINPHFNLCKTIDEVRAFYKQAHENRQRLEYEVDGTVVKINEFRFQEELGSTSSHPRWAIAYKFESPRAVTHLEAIAIQVGRTGVLTPVAVLKPVFVGGVTVSSATLHNEEEIERLDVRVGDEVELIRSGDVIPKILKVNTEARKNKRLPKFEMPEKCPSCGTKVKVEEEFVGRVCPNTKTCPAQVEGRLIHFASKDALNMEGVGPQWIAQFYAKGFAKYPSDLFKITKDQLMTLDRMGEKLAQKMLDSIASKKTTSLARVIYGLGIFHVGETLAQKIAKRVGSLEGFLKISNEDLLQIEDVGEVVVESISAFRDQNRAEIERLDKILSIEAPKTVSGKWSGKNFVLTGSLEKFSRSEAQREIEARGGSAQSSVTKATHIVIVGADAGSKLEKARKLGLTIWSEDEFIAALEDGAESVISG